MDNEEQRDHCEETYVRAMAEREGSDELAAQRYDRAAVAEATERNRRPGDTSAAIAANRRRGLERKAEELRAAGFLVATPEEVTAGTILTRHSWEIPCPIPGCAGHDRAGVERHEFGTARVVHDCDPAGPCYC